MVGEAGGGPEEPRLRPNEVRQVFEVAQTSQGLLDAFFRVTADYFPASVLLFFVGDDAIVRRGAGPNTNPASVGHRFSCDESAALGPVRGGGELGPAAITVEPSDVLVRCGAWTAGDALLLPLHVRGRMAAAVIGDSRISESRRKDLVTITSMAAAALQTIIVRRTTSAAAVSEATRIMSAPLHQEELAGEKRRRLAYGVSIGTGVVVLLATLWFFFGGKKSHTVLSLRELPDQPRVVVTSLLPLAQKASGLGDGAELVSLRATVSPDGKTDLLESGLGADPWPIRIVFASGDEVAEVEVDRGGMYPPSVRERGLGKDACGRCGCDAAAPKPRCETSKIVDAARKAGLGPNDKAIVTYSFCKVEGPRWTVSAPGRGEIRLSDTTCNVLGNDMLHAAPRKLDTIPGAPRVDPVALVDEARKQVGLASPILVRIEAWFVGKDGTVEVGRGRPGRVEYTFAGANDASKRIERVVLDGDGLAVRSSDIMDGVRPAPKPTCSIATLWRSTLSNAPTNELAHVIYEAGAGSGGAWTIELSASSVHQVQPDVICAAWN